jgi:ketosteroid isomerase-like protein
MSEADNVRILREAFSALARGDISNFLAYMSDDIELEHLLPREVWPYGGSGAAKQKARNTLQDWPRCMR